ncbi:MAG: YdeI/OmpD-associated family protein [Clostridiales bacterium]|nr:YdeI/OmpD-associated family protein [Clostridiales bacterium]
MKACMEFSSSSALRTWLERHGASHEGFWLRFCKDGSRPSVTRAEALEEALCCGWIDGQMQKIADTEYQVYFARRKKASKWSARNRDIAARLEAQGRMTDAGRAAIQMAKDNGTWDLPQPPRITEEQVAAMEARLLPYPTALENFKKMSPSVRRSYTGGYLAAKTEAGREKQLVRMVSRLKQNLKPM